MKQFFKYFFASLLAMVVAGVIVFGIISGLMVSAVSNIGEKPTPPTPDNTILEINLKQQFPEQGMKNSIAMFTDENSYNAGLYDVIKAIHEAKKDKSIKGIYLKTGGTPVSWATAEQIYQALKDFQTTDKFIYAYGEYISQKDLFITAAADKVFLNPVGSIELNGLSTTIPFFKGTLDKLDIKPEIFYAGKFKSATEPFRAYEASEANKLQIRAYQDDIWKVFLRAVAAKAQTSDSALNDWVQKGMIMYPTDAERYKIVNGLKYEDEVISILKKETEVEEKDNLRFTKLDNYAANVKSKRKMTDNRIALLVAEGEIVSGKGNGQLLIASDDLVASIRSLKNNKKVKAVVMRVNSPGGSALASDVILRELEQLQKKKPLVVSMGDVAASGGYYISSKANKIYALPTTLTGSIGVFSMMVNVENLLKNKLGITTDHIKNAPYADFPNATRALQGDEAARLQAYVDTIYHTFKSHVSKGRKISLDAVDSIAQGRVWTGEAAKSIGLVDGIGGLDSAINAAAQLAKLKEYSVSTYPEPLDKFEMLLRRYGNNAQAAIAGDYIEQQLGSDYQYYQQLQKLVRMNKKVMAILPFIIQQ